MRRLVTHVMPLFLLVGAGFSPAIGAPATKPKEPATTTILRGTFTDSAKYTGTGSVRVTRRAGVRTLRVGRNFRADPGAIRLRMYLATTPSGDRFIDLGPMRETGAHAFRVPARVSLSTYRYAIAWCAVVDEPITQAKLVRPR